MAYRRIVANMDGTNKFRVLDLLFNQGLSGGGWAVATTTTAVKNATAFNWVRNYTTFNKAATDNQAVSAAAQATATFCLYLLSINDAGAVAATKGADLAKDPGIDNQSCPVCPASQVPVAILKVQNTSGSNFTLGTTSLTAAGITATFQDQVLEPDFLFGTLALGTQGYAPAVPVFGSEKVKALGFIAKTANTGNVFWGDSQIDNAGVRGNSVSKTTFDYVGFGAIFGGAASDIGMVNLKDFFVHGSAASNAIFIDVSN